MYYNLQKQFLSGFYLFFTVQFLILSVFSSRKFQPVIKICLSLFLLILSLEYQNFAWLFVLFSIYDFIDFVLYFINLLLYFIFLGFFLFVPVLTPLSRYLPFEAFPFFYGKFFLPLSVAFFVSFLSPFFYCLDVF